MARIYATANSSNFREYSDGLSIGGGLALKPAPYLPILTWDSHRNAGIVIKKGTIISITSDGYIVPCNGGIADQTYTYTQLDIDNEVIDFDLWATTQGAVEAAGASSENQEALLPVGLARYDIYRWDMGEDPWYRPQTEVAILEDRLVLIALDETHESEYTYANGQWMVSDDEGFPVPLTLADMDLEVTVSGASGTGKLELDDVTAAFNQIVGRLIKVIDLETTDTHFTGGLEHSIPVPGLGLPGVETEGISDGIDTTTSKGLLIQLTF